MYRLLVLIASLFPAIIGYCQDNRENELITAVANAKTSFERLSCLEKLSEFYYVYRADKKGDSILRLQLLEAELSSNNDVLEKTLFGNAILNIPAFSSSETFDKALSFLDKGLAYARDNNHKDLAALTHIRKAGLLRKRGNYELAIQETSMAFPLLKNGNDSLQAVLYIELGEIFLAKGDALSACRYFNNGYDIAYSLKSIPLRSAIYHRFADLYLQLQNKELAKKSLLESLQLNMQHQEKEGILQDYIDLARITDEKEYLTKALALAEALKSFRYILLSKRLMFFYLMVVEKNSQAALQYLQQNDDLKRSFFNQGEYAYQWAIGNTYHYGNKPELAINYYLGVKDEILSSFDNKIKYSTLGEIADCYARLNNPSEAIHYYEQAFKLGEQTKSLAGNAAIAERLGSLYAVTGDYKNAYKYTQLQKAFGDTLQQLSKQRELTLLDIDRERMRHEKDLQEAAANDLRRRNLQYTGISMATAFLFIILIVFGMFPISKTTIRMLNFFSFICLFEFIILLIDNWLHDLAHGEPLKIWLAKIFIIALLLPLHHFLEHVAIKFLSSQKLVKFRQRFSFSQLFHPSKKKVIRLKKNLEESTSDLTS